MGTESQLRSSLMELIQVLQERSERCPLPQPYNVMLGQQLESWQRILAQMREGPNHASVAILRSLHGSLIAVERGTENPRRWMPIRSDQHDYMRLIHNMENQKTELTLDLLEKTKASPGSQRSSSDSLSQAMATPRAAGPSGVDTVGAGFLRNDIGRQDTQLVEASSPHRNGEDELQEVQRSWKKLYNEVLALRPQWRGQKSLRDKRKEILAFLDLREWQSPRSLPWVDVWNEEMLETLFTIAISNDMDQTDKRHAGKAILAIASKDSNACFFIAKNCQDWLESLILFLASDSRPVLVELLSVLSKSPDLECQDVIVNGSGVEPLLEIVEDRESTWEEKKEAAVVLADLAKCPRAKKSYTEEVDFPRRAVQLIRTNEPLPVRVELTRALLFFMEEDTAATMLIRDADGLRAFAAVLEAHKGELADLDLIAVALTTLIEQDLAAAKQALGEERLLSLLCQCQRPARSRVAALELINRLLEEERARSNRTDGGNLCKRLIVQEDFQALQSILTSSASPKAKELTVIILLMLSRAYKDDSIASVLLNNQIWVLLFTVIEDSSSTDLAVENAIKAVRNLSLINDIMTQMEPKRVTKMLMDTIHHHHNNASIVHKAVKTLERFVPSGELCEPSNIRLLVSLLGRSREETELLSCTVMILGKLAIGSGSHDRKLCKIMSEHGAAESLRAMLTGPGSHDQKVCKIMLERGAAEFLRTMLTYNELDRDHENNILRLLAWLVNHAPGRSALGDLKTDSEFRKSIENLTKRDSGWKGVADRALSKLK